MNVFFHLAITCAAPTITGGSTDCTSPTSAWGATCTLTCDAGYTISGSASLTCGDSDSDGTGDFGTSTCSSGLSLSITLYY